MQIPVKSQIKYLLRRHEEFALAQDALRSGDFSSIQNMGHKWKGNGATFGFPELGDLGAELEEAASDKRRAVVDQLIVQFERWLEAHPVPN